MDGRECLWNEHNQTNLKVCNSLRMCNLSSCCCWTVHAAFFCWSFAIFSFGLHDSSTFFSAASSKKNFFPSLQQLNAVRLLSLARSLAGAISESIYCNWLSFLCISEHSVLWPFRRKQHSQTSICADCRMCWYTAWDKLMAVKRVQREIFNRNHRLRETHTDVKKLFCCVGQITIPGRERRKGLNVRQHPNPSIIQPFCHCFLEISSSYFPTRSHYIFHKFTLKMVNADLRLMRKSTLLASCDFNWKMLTSRRRLTDAHFWISVLWPKICNLIF